MICFSFQNCEIVFFGVSDGQISGMLVQCFEHPKRDLALNDDKFLEPVQKT
jgi:hypothetical protein